MSLAAALTLVLALPPFATASAQEVMGDEDLPRLRSALGARASQSSAALKSVQAVVGETTWVGYRASQTNNYWKIGVGPNRPGTSTDGYWDFDHPVNGDSLQGWWPLRRIHTNSSGAILPDTQRPWWAVEYGNISSYVINQGGFDVTRLGTAYAGNRTFGVVGVWHSDPGNGTPGLGVTWAPLTGARSAWMGLRRHGDLTVVDPITGNAFNENTQVLIAATTQRTFPGYGSQMDQMLYRDLDLSGAPADSGVRVTFRYRTTMSTGKATSSATRTGWYEGDPLSLNTITPGNFISAEAGVPANSQAPVDSFQVYVGAPVEGTFMASDNVTRPIHDPLRRWFNEVLAKDTRYWKFARAGNDSGQVTLVITKAQKDAIVAAAGSPTLRVVFRVHTNQNSSDQSGYLTYTSNGRGAAQVDDVRYDAGLGSVLIGDFEGGDPAKDIDNLQPASAAWRSTGKPPAITFHTHDLATLEWNDLCGLPGSSTATCDMKGTVISMGDHDRGEATAGADLTPERAGKFGIVSPTIGLEAPGPNTPNSFDITGEMAASPQYLFSYQVYTGIFDVFSTGVWWYLAGQYFPATLPDGTQGWSEMRQFGYSYFNPVVQCLTVHDDLRSGGVVPIADADSVRMTWAIDVQCYRFGVISGCGPTAGAYLDHVALGLARTSAPPLSADIWDWFQDTFPFNETAGLPGTPAFDTTSALIRTGLNIAQLTYDLQRYDVPGDSALVTATGADTRVDLVFRVYPGPGNHVTVGSPASGLRRVPTSTTAVSPSDGSWFGTWMSLPGDFATPGAVGLHSAWPGGWNPNVWMSARCDTAQMNLFPIDARGIGQLPAGRWMSAYHEDDPHLAVLGVARNRCFLVSPTGANDASNITCSTVPAWVSAGGTGYDGSPTTVEATSIFPDGLFTPGTQVQYFWRRSAASAPAVMAAMVPDTGTVVPQPGEDSYDGHRWQAFGVLPDRWKDIEYGGFGDACMLVIDAADRRGEELAWISAADSVGLSMFTDVGYNGWGYGGLNPNDPASFVAAHSGQAGTVFDLYQVKANESLTAPAGTIGSRLSYRDPSPTNLVHGKYSRQGPTLEMLAAYYKMVVLLAGDLNYQVLGPYTDRSQDDTGLLRQFLEMATPLAPRALISFGDGLASSLAADPFLTDVLGVDHVAESYSTSTSDPARTVRLTPTTALMNTGDRFGVRSSCMQGPGVIAPHTATVTEAVIGATLGASAATAIVHKPSTVDRPWLATTHSFAFGRLVTDGGLSTRGRMTYLHRLFYLGSYSPMCYWPGDGGPAGVPATDAFVDGVRLFNTPLAHGSATVEFTLAAPDRVTIGLYDVGGRLVRTLAERAFEAGAQRLAWDGTDDAGRRLNAGVYFARVRYAARGFESARKVVVLK